jgi:GH18 family chitinase
MKSFRNYLGPNKILSMATTPVENKIKALDFSVLNGIVDFYNMMTYDFTSGAWG